MAADALDEVAGNFEEVSPSATRVKVRDRYVGLPPRKEGYAEWIPTLLTRDYHEPVTFADLARYLAFEYEDLCRATPDELRTCLPPNLPFLTHVNEWHHREYNNHSADRAPNGDKPSSYETFPLIAEVLVSGDPLPPHTHADKPLEQLAGSRGAVTDPTDHTPQQNDTAPSRHRHEELDARAGTLYDK